MKITKTICDICQSEGDTRNVLVNFVSAFDGYDRTSLQYESKNLCIDCMEQFIKRIINKHNFNNTSGSILFKIDRDNK